MKSETPAWRRDLWLPGLVGLLGILISLTGWGVLVADRRAQTLETTRNVAKDTRAAIALRLDEQLQTLRGLVDFWTRFGLRPPSEWEANVDQRVDRLPGLTSVAWIDLEDPDYRIATGEHRPDADVARDAEDALQRRHRPSVVGPERGATGAILYRIFLPARAPNDHEAVLVGRFSIGPFLETVLRGRASGHALSVSWDGEQVFSRGVATTDRWQDWWRVDGEVELPLGGSWQIVHRPTPELAATLLSPVPHYLLVAGIALSLVLAVLVHQLRVILRQSRFLAAGNRALEQRGLELESKVNARTEELREAVAELEAFNYSVSHDLRSPLGAVLNFATILEEDYRGKTLDAEGIALLVRIRRSAERAASLLEGLLNLSRAGRAALAVEPIDMVSLARESFAQVRAAEEESEEVAFLVHPLPAASGDRALLGDVFANLLGNALKYSQGREERRIEVRGWLDGDEAVYEVADNGQGFEMRFADKLFGVFERLHPSEEVKGTGAGLAIVARIVRRHGGRVWAEGKPDAGARFFFTLPRRSS